MNEVIPVMANLRARHFDVTDRCNIFEEQGKTVQHVLRGCRLSRASWSILDNNMSSDNLSTLVNLLGLSSCNAGPLEISKRKIFTWDGPYGTIKMHFF